MSAARAGSGPGHVGNRRAGDDPGFGSRFRESLFQVRPARYAGKLGGQGVQAGQPSRHQRHQVRFNQPGQRQRMESPEAAQPKHTDLHRCKVLLCHRCPRSTRPCSRPRLGTKFRSDLRHIYMRASLLVRSRSSFPSNSVRFCVAKLTIASPSDSISVLALIRLLGRR